MYRTFARTPEEAFNRHPYGPTVRGLVGVMMCLNFLSFLSASLRPPRFSASRANLHLPSSNPFSPSLSLSHTHTHTLARSISNPPLLSYLSLSPIPYLSSSPFHSLSPSLLPPSLPLPYPEYTHTRAYSRTRSGCRSLCRCLVVTDDPYEVRVHAGTCTHRFRSWGIYTIVVCSVDCGRERRRVPSRCDDNDGNDRGQDRSALYRSQRGIVCDKNEHSCAIY